jgi:hypothetical protein
MPIFEVAGGRQVRPENCVTAARSRGRNNLYWALSNEDSQVKRKEEKEGTSLTPERRDIAIDMASRCAAEKQTANSKQQTANSKQQTANSKQQTANSKQQTANSKQLLAMHRPSGVRCERPSHL